MEIKGIHMTDEFSANYFLQQGYLAGRVEFLGLRKDIANEIEEKRKPYLDYCNDKQSEDYQFYLGFCNGMKLAALVAEKPNGN
jgi:hypothetical protein